MKTTLLDEGIEDIKKSVYDQLDGIVDKSVEELQEKAASEIPWTTIIILLALIVGSFVLINYYGTKKED